MIGTNSARAGNSRRGSIGVHASGAVLLAWIAIFMAPPGNAAEPAREVGAQGHVADLLNHHQAASAAAPMAPLPRSGPAAEDVGILFLRSDGGDPRELRVDDRSNVIFIARPNGEGRAYRYGREIDINPPFRESAAQIAIAQFGTAAGTAVAVSQLPAAAQEALLQFQANAGAVRVLYSHIASRKDTGWVSDQRATKILAMEASANGRNDLVALIKMAMTMFDLKSDACDNSSDSRCDQPGVREAFAQIKREEALQRTAARF
jgi:hypothetical protein